MCIRDSTHTHTHTLIGGPAAHSCKYNSLTFIQHSNNKSDALF